MRSTTGFSELLNYAKANPAKISFASIPYKGSAAAFTDLVGGQLDLFGDAAQGLVGPAKAGIRAHDPAAFERARFLVSPAFGLAFDPSEPFWVPALARHCLQEWRSLGRH